MNVAPGDTALLSKPFLPENKGRTCEVIAKIPDKHGRVIWLCRFREKIKTTLFHEVGMINVASIEDWRLIRLASPSILIGTVTISYKKKRRQIQIPRHSAV